MAGFDFDIACTPRQREYVKALLRFSQRIAATRGCTIRYRWQRELGYYVTADGPLIGLQALVATLADKLGPYAEADSSALRRPERVRLADRVLSAYTTELHEITSFVAGVADEIHGVPGSYVFDVGRATHLKGRVQSFTYALVMYHEGRLSDAQIIEECHTILELLLKSVLQRDGRQCSFASLVQLARGKGYLDEELKNAVLELKDVRREAKHRGQGVPAGTMNRLLPRAVEACHRLTAVLRAHQAA